jgi:hypothetical protein
MATNNEMKNPTNICPHVFTDNIIIRGSINLGVHENTIFPQNTKICNLHDTMDPKHMLDLFKPMMQVLFLVWQHSV